MDWHLDAIFAGVSVFGVAIGLGKWAISRALRDLDYVMLKVNEIMVRLSKLDMHDAMLKEHADKIEKIIMQKAKL